MSEASKIAAVLMSAAVLTGMSHARWSGQQRGQRHHHTPARLAALSRSEPVHVELGGARIPLTPANRHEATGVVTSRTRAAHPSLQDSGVIVGYVGSDATSNAFHRLSRVEEGDRVKVVHRDGRIAWFKVDSVRRVRGPADPGGRTMNADGRPELRLITRRDGSASAPRNVVVSAHQVTAAPASRTPPDVPAPEEG